MVSAVVATVGYGALSILAQKELLNKSVPINRRATQTIRHVRIIFMEAAQSSRDNRVLPPSLHNYAPASRVIARGYLHLRT